LEFFFLK